jgi:hypothetical protein
MERVVRNEGEEGEVEEEQAEPTEPTVPPPETVSMEIQTGESFLFDQKTGSFSQREEPAPSGSSSKKEEPEEKKTDIQKDDTAPKKEPAKRLYHGADTTGNEDDSIFREHVLQMVIMVNGQGSTIKVIQLLLNIDICSGM